MSGELFSERVKRWRLRHGLSQEEAGVRLGVSGRYIGMLERGDKEVELSSSLAKLFAIYERDGEEEIEEEHPGEERRTLSVGGPYSGRAMDEPSEPRPSGAVARSDAEIAGLAALLSEHAAQVNAGARSGELPVVKRALELALEKRGVLPPAKNRE